MNEELLEYKRVLKILLEVEKEKRLIELRSKYEQSLVDNREKLIKLRIIMMKDEQHLSRVERRKRELEQQEIESSRVDHGQADDPEIHRCGMALQAGRL